VDAAVTPRHHAAPPAQLHGWAGFVHRYGWRAYAVPILAVITVVALFSETTSRPARARVAAAGTSAHHHGGTLEGVTGGNAQYQPGSTPAPLVIKLKTDGPTSCATNRYAKLILVSISRQHLWACQGSTQVNSSPVTTGKITDGDQTPLGSWRVQAKQRNRYLVGPGYKDYVRY
jgi:hypothetical protein